MGPQTYRLWERAASKQLSKWEHARESQVHHNQNNGNNSKNKNTKRIKKELDDAVAPKQTETNTTYSCQRQTREVFLPKTYDKNHGVMLVMIMMEIYYGDDGVDDDDLKKPSHTNLSTQWPAHLHTHVFTRTCIYAKKLLHGDVFTQREIKHRNCVETSPQETA